mgnify:CR=1 FL=1
MALPEQFKGKLSLPVICAPMFLVSNPSLVINACKNGVVGTFPALNTRPQAQLDDWLFEIKKELQVFADTNPELRVAPFGVNQVVHPSNTRLEADQALVRKHKVPFVITSQGDPTGIVKDVHNWGGIVFHDVIYAKHARKAIAAGVDGIIIVAAGAGGHGGTTNPFALIREIREFWDGPVALAGAINDGYAIRAAETLGADMAYMGTRFIATQECHADPMYKKMLVESDVDDILYTDYFTGVNCNYLKASIEKEGIDMKAVEGKKEVDLDLGGSKSWKDIWSGGHGTAGIKSVPLMKDLVSELKIEYKQAVKVPSFLD